MNIFELLFLAAVITTLVVVPAAFLQMIRERQGAKRVVLGVVSFWVLYLGVVIVVSALRPQRRIPFGQERCFDDMCFTVAHVETFGRLGVPSEPLPAKGVFYIVTIRVENRGRGRAQSEEGIRALLLDDGKQYRTSPEGQRAWEKTRSNSALTTQLAAGGSVVSAQVFDVPPTATSPELLLTHGFTPGYFVIGESPIVREPAIQLLSR